MRKSSTKLFISKNMKGLKVPIILLSCLSLILSLTAILFAFFSKQTIDAAVDGQQSLFLTSAIIISSIIVLQIVTSGVNQYLRTYYLGQSNIQIKKSLFSKILGARLKDTTKHHSGVMMNYLNSDVETLSEGIIDVIPKLIFFIARFAGAFALLYILDHLFALMFAAFGLILFIFSRVISFEMKKRHHALQNAEANLRSLMQESLENIPVIKSFEAEQLMTEKLSKLQLLHFKALRKKQVFNIFASSDMHIFFAFGYAFAIIFGATRLQENIITFGTLTAMIQLVQHIQSPFSGLSQLVPKYHAMTASAERLMMIDQFEPEEFHTINEHTEFESLIIEDLGFKYAHQYIIEKLTCQIKKGSFIHVHGESGKGKTTLFKLLLGLYQPQEGFIFFTKGKDKYLCDATTRHLFSYVPQGNLMLSGTIKENLELYQKSTEENLIQACKIACIYDLIQELPDGFDTMLGEKGFGLSEGQIQRLAIARALLNNSPILLLDEITSALDPETEKSIFASIKSLTNKTCFIISHRKLPKDLIDQSIDL
ncbi:MAG: ABC transporter ATP-binding protein/permease [Tenericutes bacterium]|nr:ABC transporter ATP-binding protein/permease [Mycoplasmatota bacterium]